MESQSDSDGELDQKQVSPSEAAIAMPTAAGGKLGPPPTSVQGKQKIKIKKRVIVNVSRCRYEVVQRAAKAMGWIVESYEPVNPQPEKQPNDRLHRTSSQRPFVSASRSSTSSTSTAAAPFSRHSSVQSGLKDPEWANSEAAKLVRKYRKVYDPEVACHIYWHDMSVLLTRVASLRCWQRVNHFPGMTIICRKGALAIQLNKLQSKFPEYCDFFPVSFSLKNDRNRLNQYCQSLKKTKTFIMKPNSGCQGRGIILTRHPMQVANSLEDQDYTVQAYIHRPLLIDKKKFDMRVYVLVTSVTNLTVFVHREGLVRICAHEYVKPAKNNLNDARVHLTNYAVNKGDEAFERNDEDGADGSVGNKRDFRFLERYVNEVAHESESKKGGGAGSSLRGGTPSSSKATLDRKGSTTTLPPITASSTKAAVGAQDTADADEEEEEEAAFGDLEGLTPWQALWRRIDKAIILTIASGLESVLQNYQAATSSSIKAKDGRMCFELLGFDVLVTQSMQPYVVEVNHSPSLVTDAPIDERIKFDVLTDVFRQLNPYLLDVRKAGELQYGKQILPKQGFAIPDPTNPDDPSGTTPFFVETPAHSKSGFRRIYPVPLMQVDRTGDLSDCEDAEDSTGPTPSVVDDELAAIYKKVLTEVSPLQPSVLHAAPTCIAGK